MHKLLANQCCKYIVYVQLFRSEWSGKECAVEMGAVEESERYD